MKAIINATLVMRDHLIPDAVLLIEDGKIADFGEMRTTAIPEGCEIPISPFDKKAFKKNLWKLLFPKEKAPAFIIILNSEYLYGKKRKIKSWLVPEIY